MIRINLLQIKEEIRRASIRNYLILAVVLVLVSMLVAWGWHGGITSRIDTTNRVIRHLNDEITRVSKIIGEVERIKQQKADLEAKLHTIQNLGVARKYSVAVMNELARTMPEELWLDELELEEGRLTLEGRSVDNQIVGEFYGKLEDSVVFDALEYGPSVQSAGEGGVKLFKFTVSANLVPLTVENFVSQEELEAAQQ